MLKGKEFKGKGIGYARTCLEPVKPSGDFPNSPRAYTLRHNGKICLCYCDERYQWLLTTLVKHGVDIRHFSGNSPQIPERKCKEIAVVLKKVVKQSDLLGKELSKQDIKFWNNCGGVKNLGWVAVSELGY